MLVTGTAWLLVLALLSLRWRTQHDAPLMLYVAWMMDAHGAVPYRDIYDMNLPGTYFANLVIGHATGYSDPGLRIADLAILAAILAATFTAMRRFGLLAAWAGTILFGLLYLGSGPHMSLQREYLILLPLSLAIAAASRLRDGNRWRTSFAIGFLLSCAATVKPHALLGLPLLLAYVALEAPAGERPSRRVGRVLVAALAGAAIPAAVVVGYLATSGAWSSFVEFFRGFAPIYASVNGNRETVMPGDARAAYLFRELAAFGGARLWAVLGVAGIAIGLTDRGPNRRFAALLAALVVAYSVSVVLQGRFFDYHWLIAHFFVLLLASLCLVERPELWRPRSLAVAPVLAIALVAWQELPVHPLVRAQLHGVPVPPPKAGRPDQIAAFLRERMKPGDLVQPLDITGGAVHGMLLARAPIATPFLYDSFFYIRVSEPFVQKLRSEFLERMTRVRPRFVVDVYAEDKPWVRGADTTREFPELRAMLARDYVRVGEGLGTAIYERRPAPRPAP